MSRGAWDQGKRTWQIPSQSKKHHAGDRQTAQVKTVFALDSGNVIWQTSSRTLDELHCGISKGKLIAFDGSHAYKGYNNDLMTYTRTRLTCMQCMLDQICRTPFSPEY